jgi:transcriptional regulator of arginine metabolism
VREERHKLISGLISKSAIRRQAEIVSLLRKRGFAVTQASVSRDLEDLGITKQNGRYRLDSNGGFSGRFGKVSVVKSGNNLIVAKCASGLASALAVDLDAQEIDGVAGTIAGDDTVFVAVKTASSQASVYRHLKERFGV